ncbi:MAG: hypothetical protein NE330_18375, partial [Lentisphaeraceae bacterium]|nr:hypothetical protein [Lentisphaeraceae bacterium]
EDFYQQAHQSSARFDRAVSEFTALGIAEEYHSSKAPYVQKAKIKIGLSLEEKFDIQSNGTHFLVGKVTELILPEDIIADDGFIDLEAAGTLTVSGLDSYHRTNSLERLPYAKVSNL